MVNKEQLNTLAVRAKAGDTSSMWEIKFHFQNTIHRMSDANRNKLTSQSRFEDECFEIIEDTVRRFDPDKGDLPQLIVNFIKRRLGRSVKRHLIKTRENVVIPLVANTDSEGYAEYDIKDDLAIVDGNIMLNERITGLAAGDLRKLAILKSWTEPEYCESDTALLLAKQLGGKPESHRKAITRFRSECQKTLACAN
ncbi:hypothetical protein D1872_71260 [compost metagenome]